MNASKEKVLPILPGAVLGVLGGGQLGRLFTLEALRMGYHVWVMDPDPQSPAGLIASRHIEAGFDNEAALLEMCECAAVTIEFENIPLKALEFIQSKTRLAPAAACVAVAQDRVAEKRFAAQHDIPTVEFGVIEKAEHIAKAAQATGFPAILKTNRLGYDGKGQVVCHSQAEVTSAFESLGGVECVLEQRVDLRLELSVVLSRSDEGLVSCFPVAENSHENGILDITLVPARVDDALLFTACDLATRLADGLGYVGVMAVEFFLTEQGQILMNEMAPRPHNSGHFTLDATPTSQFDQQVRMLCGLQAGDCRLTSPVAMLNLLGERWLPDEPQWSHLYANPNSHLHLYAKAAARAGRKMGHVNILAENSESALSKALNLKNTL